MAKAKTKAKTKANMYRWWFRYYEQNGNGRLKGRLLRGNWATVGRALADWILRDASDSKRYKNLDDLGRRLDDNRDYAVRKMRVDGNKVCIHGEPRIESVSVNEPDDIDEHNERAIRQWQVKTIATNTKCYNLDRKLRGDYGFLFDNEIKRVERKLLLGNAEADIKVKEKQSHV